MEQTIKVADKPTLDSMKESMAKIQLLLGTLGAELSEVKSAVSAVKEEVTAVKTTVNTVSTNVNTVNANVNNVKSSVGSLATEVAEAGDYVISEPKVLMTTTADATGYPTTSHVYASDLVTVKGKGFIIFVSQKSYQYELADLTIDGVLVTRGYDSYAHKPSGVDIKTSNYSNLLKPLYFNKSISFRIYASSANTHYGVTYQVGLK